MAYSTSNPPFVIFTSFDGAFTLWGYSSADAIGTVDDTDYITNAGDLGMKNGQFVLIRDATNGLATIGKVTVDSDGNGTLTALTAFP